MQRKISKHGFVWLCMILLLCEFVCGCADAQVLNHDRPYLVVKSPGFFLEGQFFRPLLISGDGRVLYGYNVIGLEKWTFSSGLERVAKFPARYGFLLKGASFSGTSIVGIFGDGNFPRPDTGVFIWNSTFGLRMLHSKVLLPQKGGIVLPLYIKDSGNDISFGFQPYIPMASNGTEKDDSQELSYRTAFWNASSGLRVSNFGPQYNFSLVSGDFKHFLIGNFGSSNFRLVDSQGNYAELHGFPRDFNINDYNSFINKNGSIVAIQNRFTGAILAWNTQGVPLPDLKLPSNCGGFLISAIDAGGTFFGSSYCSTSNPKSALNEGLRITMTGAQTINEWLRSNGLPNDLGPTAIVRLVSDDGKTVFGEVPGPTLNSVGAKAVKPVTSAHGAVSKQSQEQPSETPMAFIAHLQW